MTAIALVAVKEHSQVDQSLKRENLQTNSRPYGTRNPQLGVIIGTGGAYDLTPGPRPKTNNTWW